MPAGLQCWDSNGNPIFDSTINTTRIIGTFDTNRQNGQKEIPIANGETLWACINYVVSGTTYKYSSLNMPIITISGNIISWQYSSNWSWSPYTPNCNIIYGVR